MQINTIMLSNCLVWWELGIFFIIFFSPSIVSICHYSSLSNLSLLEVCLFWHCHLHVGRALFSGLKRHLRPTVFYIFFFFFLLREDNQKRQEKVFGKKDKHIISINKCSIIWWFSCMLLFRLLTNCFTQIVKYSYLYVTQKEMRCPGEANSWFADCLQAVNCNLNIFAIHKVDK